MWGLNQDSTRSRPVCGLTMLGWVYIFTNKAMPGLVKVGYTTKGPKERARKLDHSGVPYPYVVEYAVQVEEPHSFEQQVHRNLADCREGKEWFRCSVTHAATAIDKEISSVRPALAYSEKEATPEPEPLHRIRKAAPSRRLAVHTGPFAGQLISVHEIIIVSVLVGLFIYGLSLVLLSTIFGDVWSMRTLYIVCLVPSVSGGMWTMKMYASRALTA